MKSIIIYLRSKSVSFINNMVCQHHASPNKSRTSLVKTNSIMVKLTNVLLFSLEFLPHRWYYPSRWSTYVELKFLAGFLLLNTNKANRHDITEMLWKIALDTIALTTYPSCCLIIVLSVLLRYTACYYFFGILELVLQYTQAWSCISIKCIWR